MSVADFYDAWDKPERPALASVHPINAGATGHAKRYVERALEDEVDRVRFAPEGTRNHTLNTAAFNLGGLIPGGYIAEQTVRDALAQAAFAAGLEEREIEATLNSGIRSGKHNPREIPDLATAVTVPPVTTIASLATLAGQEEASEDLAEALAAKVREHLPRIDWHALWADDSEEEWIIEPLLPARRLVALYSAPKVGKSLLMLELAVGVARGTAVLGTTPDRPRRVLYVDFENDPKGDIRERLQSMGFGPDDLEQLDYLSFPRLSALDSEQGGLELMAAVQTYGSEVVVIDTVSRAIKGEENENDTWLAFYRHTGLKLKSEGIALIRLDHTGKDETKGQRGGSAKSGDVDAVWRMSKVTDDMFRLDCEANRMPVAEKTIVLKRRPTPHLHHDVDAKGKLAAWEAKVSAVIAAMDAAGLPQDAGAPKARELVRSSGLTAGNDVVAEAVKRRKLTIPQFGNSNIRSVRDWRGQLDENDLSEESPDSSWTGV